MAGEKIIENDRFRVYMDRERLRGQEKPHRVYTGDDRVLVQQVGADMAKAVSEGMGRIGAGDVLAPGDLVAIKVNLGGGIHGVLPTYTDPEIVEGLVDWLRAAGCKPFVCEANMRGHTITPQLLQVRGYTGFMTAKKVPFVNLSTVRRVSFSFLGIHKRVDLPLLLLRPNVKIISCAPPKHHWECGITCAQKNLYGAISEHKKSRYHRAYELIDHVVAAAARVMKPALSVIGTRQLGAGLGPHFAIPFDFNRIIFARDMLSCDMYCAEILGYPVDRIKHFQINSRGRPVSWTLIPGSVPPDPAALARIRANAIPPGRVDRSKKTLFVQYFVPSFLQTAAYHHFEWLLTWLNRRFYVPRGDPPPGPRRRGAR
ncbi:MAG: DUF362 domain-containing protein [Candidatus Lokiarchaeota archaeon]|nr:DUF362 domain-containing protein [Candidatus Lokiarchaeota archaeon]